MPIIFSNPGLIDPRCITTLGVNVKEGASPIGFFGTGLKYALATLLRNGCAIDIYSGSRHFSFSSKPDIIRGKSFSIIHMQDSEAAFSQPLGFTTDLGKQWTLENAYRELHSNSLDEGGAGGEEHSGAVRCAVGATSILITGQAFEAVHLERFKFLLNPRLVKLLSTKELEVFLGKTNSIFYRGIKVAETQRPLNYTYNIHKPLTLTEDRTAYEFQYRAALESCVVKHFSEEMCLTVLGTEGSYETSYLDFTFATSSPAFDTAVQQLLLNSPEAMNESARALHFRKRGAEGTFDTAEFTEAQRAQLSRAICWCEKAGFSIPSFPVILSPDLGKNVLACASGGKIWLTAKCFDSTDLLRRALIEEYIHLQFKVSDHSRAMQNVLFEQILRLAAAVSPRSPQ